MAKNPNVVSKEMLDKAREQALAKKARMMAEAELGISDDKMPVVKGPPPEVENDPKIEVYFNLPEFQHSIVLDGVKYFHGQTRFLPQRVADVCKEQMARAWQHQAEIDGKEGGKNFYLRQQQLNTAINLGSGQRVQLPPTIAAEANARLG